VYIRFLSLKTQINFFFAFLPPLPPFPKALFGNRHKNGLSLRLVRHVPRQARAAGDVSPDKGILIHIRTKLHKIYGKTRHMRAPFEIKVLPPRMSIFLIHMWKVVATSIYRVLGGFKPNSRT
jgi:hypothetical protein